MCLPGAWNKGHVGATFASRDDDGHDGGCGDTSSAVSPPRATTSAGSAAFSAAPNPHTTVAIPNEVKSSVHAGPGWVPHCYTTIADTTTSKTGLSEPILVSILSEMEPVPMSRFALAGLREQGHMRIPREPFVKRLERMAGVDAATTALHGKLRHIPAHVERNA